MSSQVSGLSDLLKSNLDRGVSSNEDELLQRRDIFGANTYPRKKRKSIWVRSFPYAMAVTFSGVPCLIVHCSCSLVGCRGKRKVFHDVKLFFYDKYKFIKAECICSDCGNKYTFAASELRAYMRTM